MVCALNSTSVTITLPDSDDSCKPYYVWIAGITPNGQQSPYSKRRRVEVCKASGGESKNMYIPYQKAYFSTCKSVHCTYILIMNMIRVQECAQPLSDII